jgi:hypothetical protein
MPQGQSTRQPPQAPEIERRILLTRLQAIGLPILLLVPLLALAGVFGLSRGQRSAQGNGLSIDVEYPSRARVRASDSLAVTVRNELDQAVDGVAVRIDREYVDSFAQVDFAPSVSSLSEASYSVDLGRLPAGATRAVTVRLSPRDQWLRQGFVSVSGDGIEESTVEFATFVFP